MARNLNASSVNTIAIQTQFYLIKWGMVFAAGWLHVRWIYADATTETMEFCLLNACSWYYCMGGGFYIQIHVARIQGDFWYVQLCNENANEFISIRAFVLASHHIQNVNVKAAIIFKYVLNRTQTHTHTIAISEATVLRANWIHFCIASMRDDTREENRTHKISLF